jgi:ferritin-like metal-binding protein YciE
MINSIVWCGGKFKLKIKAVEYNAAQFFKQLQQTKNMEPLVNLRDLLQHEIDDLYSAEEQIIEALPKMAEKATNSELKKALNEHLRVTREQKKRLDKVKSLLKIDEEKKGFFEKLFGGTKCKGTEGLITEGEKMMGEDMDPRVMDAAIIAAAQKIEHYEISGYGTARTYASELGLKEVASLLETTINEEYKSDDMLTALALRKVNLDAEIGGGPGTKKASSANTVTASKRSNGTERNGSNSGKQGGQKVQRSDPKKAASKSGSKTAIKKAAKKGAPKKSAKKAARR